MFEEMYDDFCVSDIKTENLREKMREYHLAPKDIKFLKKIINNFNDSSVDDVMKAVLIFLFYCDDEAMVFCKERGLFSYKDVAEYERYSIDCLHMIKKYSQYIRLSKENLEYVDAKIANEWIAKTIKEQKQQIDKYIKHHEKDSKKIKVEKENKEFYVRTSLFRELIAYAEYVFLSDKNNIILDDSNLNILSVYSKEDICEAVSYLLYRYKQIIGVHYADNLWIDADYILSDEMDEIILLACKLIKLREWDFLLDNYDFSYDDSKKLIYHKDVSLEKSIKLGYIETQIQKDIYFRNFQDTETASLTDLFDKCFANKKLAEWLVEKIGDGENERYILRSPVEVLYKIGEYQEEKIPLYKEDCYALGYAYKENIYGIDDRMLTEHASIMDALLVHRLFVINAYYYQYMLKIASDKKCLIRSLGALLKKEDLKILINSMLKDSQKVNELIEFFTYNGKGRFDLQYTPFIEYGESYLCIPSVICAYSNVIRNSIAYAYQCKRILQYDSGEELEKQCYELFCKHANIFQVRMDVKFSFNGQKGEIDILAITDNELFIIECKNPLLFVDSYSMRTTYSYIKKAKKQLDLAVQAFSNLNFMNDFLKRNKLEYHVRKIYTCVISGNRLFAGYLGIKHPIRTYNVLYMLMNTGSVRIRINDQVFEENIWLNDEFSVKDLIRFISNDSILDKVYFQAMTEYDSKMNFGEHEIRLRNYKLDGKKMIYNLGAYTVKTRNQN